MSTVTTHRTTPPPLLVASLTDDLADTYTEAARVELPEGRYRRVRANVARLIGAGRLDAARALAADEVTLYAIQGQLGRHVTDCPMCCPPELTCYVAGDMERRETMLLALVANAGGGN